MNKNTRYDSYWSLVVKIGGGFLLGGVLISVSALIFNGLTADDGGGANIGAGILFLAGALCGALGGLTAACGLIGVVATRRRPEGL